MTLEITNQQASKNILLHVAERRLTQGDWHKREDDGREIACLLGAINPAVESTKDCNGKLMPEWLAELTVSLFDGLPNNDNIIYSTARRYGNAVGKWNVLSISQWDGILTRFLVRVIDDAVEAAGAVANTQPCWELVQTACAQVKAALNGEGDLAASRAASRAAADAADAASRAADAAAYDAEDAEDAAADAADAAYQKLFSFLLDQIEAELASAV